jgi:hypothetical protein
MNIELYLNMHYLPEKSYILCYLGIIAGMHVERGFQKQTNKTFSFF